MGFLSLVLMIAAEKKNLMKYKNTDDRVGYAINILSF